MTAYDRSNFCLWSITLSEHHIYPPFDDNTIQTSKRSRVLDTQSYLPVVIRVSLSATIDDMRQGFSSPNKI